MEPANSESTDIVIRLADGAHQDGTQDGGKQVAAIEAVIDRFEQVGLRLPALIVNIGADTSVCDGHDGLIHYGADPLVVSICSSRPYVVPHELAHAWVHANLDDDDRADCVERWGLESWDDPTTDWNDRGTEHAAFIIQQNLTSSASVDSSTWANRAEAFEQVTGLPSPLRRNG